MISFATKHNDPNQKLGWAERLGYGIGGGAVFMLLNIVNSFLTIYLTNVSMVDIAVVSSILAVSKVFDGISDVIIGNIVDHTRSRFGKARVWLIRISLPFVLSVLFLFRVPALWPDMVKYVYIFLVYNFMMAFCYTFLQISQFSLISLMTSDEEEHGLLAVIRAVFANIGMLMGSALFVKLLIRFSDDPGNQNTQHGYTCALLVFLSGALVALIISMLSVKERVVITASDDDSKSKGPGIRENLRILLSDRNWIVLTMVQIVAFFGMQASNTAGTYYALYVLNDMGQFSWIMSSAMIPTMISALALPLIMKKMNKKWIYVLGVAMAGVGIIGFGLAAPVKPAMIAFNVIKGIGLGLETGVVIGIVADLISITHRRTGVHVAGLGNAGFTASDKSGSGLGSAVFGFAMSAAGFSAELAAQSAAVISMIKWMFLWMPAICFIAAAVIMAFVFNAYERKEDSEKRS